MKPVNYGRRETREEKGKAIMAEKQKVQSERIEKTKTEKSIETPGHLSHPFEKLYCRQ